jgi:hypothetical protein
LRLLKLKIFLGLLHYEQLLRHKIRKKKLVSSEPILSGADYLRDLLDWGNHKRIYSVLRMQKETFMSFCSWFRKGGFLKDSRTVGVEQQVAMFI